jgi:hypothetical protein
MTRDERVYYYQSLLMVAAIPFALVLWQSFFQPKIDILSEQKCAVYHENGPIGKKCEKKTFSMVDTD